MSSVLPFVGGGTSKPKDRSLVGEEAVFSDDIAEGKSCGLVRKGSKLSSSLVAAAPLVLLPLLLSLVLAALAAPASMPAGYSCGLRSGSKSSELAPALRALPFPAYRLVVVVAAADGPPKAVGGACKLREVGPDGASDVGAKDTDVQTHVPAITRAAMPRLLLPVGIEDMLAARYTLVGSDEPFAYPSYHGGRAGSAPAHFLVCPSSAANRLISHFVLMNVHGDRPS